MIAVHHGDGIAGLLDLQRGAATLAIGDPPWGCTKAKWDRPLDWNAWWAAHDHALAPGGVLVVFASMRLAVELIPRAPRRRPFRYDLIWRKNRSSGYLNAKKAPMRGHETLLVFGGTRYAPSFTSGHAPMNAATRVSKSELYGVERITHSKAGNTDRYHTSVLSFPCVPNDRRNGPRQHASQKPEALLRWLIRAYSAPGDLVVDAACGSGATIHAARDEGRRGVGWELHEPFARAAQRWLDATDPLFHSARRAA